MYCNSYVKVNNGLPKKVSLIFILHCLHSLSTILLWSFFLTIRWMSALKKLHVLSCEKQFHRIVKLNFEGPNTISFTFIRSFVIIFNKWRILLKSDVSTYLNHAKYLKRIKKRIMSLLKERLK